jgi:cysteinyl-tRNA synthetase
MHNAWITASGEKMSKSLTNSLLVSEVVKRVRPLELRYYLVASHYRSNVEFSFEAVEEAGVGFRRTENFLSRAAEAVGQVVPADALPADFTQAMDDDLSTPAAVAVVHEFVRAGNTALAEDDRDSVAAIAAAVRGMLGIFGVDPQAEPWVSREQPASRGTETVVIDKLVSALLQQRQQARDRRDFAAADTIRDQLSDVGVDVEDTPHGPRWTVRT